MPLRPILSFLTRRDGRGSPQQRVTLFTSCLFVASGTVAAYGGIWLKLQGFSESQIGIINAVPLAMLMLLNLWIGRMADRAGDWRDTLLMLSLVAVIGPVGLMLGGGFWPVLLFWTVFLLTHGLISPVADAALMRMGRRVGFDFAAVRAWGTVGYITGIALTGILVWLAGPAVFLPLMLAGVCLRAFTASRLPLMRAGQTGAAPAGARRLAEVMRPWFLLPLAGWALVLGTLNVLGPFQALLWEQQGLSAMWITLLVALAPVAETVLFFRFRRFGHRFRARHLILAAALLTALRMAGLALEPGPAWLVPLQLMHAVTYGIGFLGCIAFIANWTSEDIAAEAQSFFVVMQQVTSVGALIGFGWLSQTYGGQAWYAMAALALVGAALVGTSLRLKEPPRP